MSDSLALSISLILNDHIVLRLRDLLAVLIGTSLDQVLLRRNLARSLTLNSHRLASIENINTLAKSNVFDIDLVSIRVKSRVDKQTILQVSDQCIVVHA